MERLEITEGLRQAIERGESLESAKLSFINAGYSKEDVEDSARVLGGVISELPEIKPVSQEKIQKQNKKQQEIEFPKQVSKQAQEKKQIFLKIITVFLFIIFIAAVSVLVLLVVYKEKTTEFLEKIIGYFNFSKYFAS